MLRPAFCNTRRSGRSTSSKLRRSASRVSRGNADRMRLDFAMRRIGVGMGSWKIRQARPDVGSLYVQLDSRLRLRFLIGTVGTSPYRQGRSPGAKLLGRTERMGCRRDDSAGPDKTAPQSWVSPY